MSNWLTARILPQSPLASAPRRSRWPVFFSALSLLWCAGWYCREESQVLLFLAMGLAALAVARPRALPGTARWVIWSGLLLTLCCLAANVTRLMPPDNALAESRTLDRVVTVAFALGLTSLFFRSSVNGMTLAAVGGLPMAMVVLARDGRSPGAAGDFALLIVWGFVALLVAADLAQQVTRTRLTDEGAPGLGELGRRLAFLSAVVALAFGLRLPVEWAVKGVQKRLFGWMMIAERPAQMDNLLLTLPPPVDFGQRMRVVLLVGADGMPGYLRERAFVRYRDGQWSVTKPDLPLKEASSVTSASKRNVYALTPDLSRTAPSVWRVEVMSSALLTCFCLPGQAVTLACDGPPPVTDLNGTVAANGVFPDSYDLTVKPGRLFESAYAWPDGRTDPLYLEVPTPLAGAVSNWVTGCAGFADAPTLPVAVLRIENYFATNFTYRLGLRMKATPDPLVDFMAQKKGACTLFASAAALMFRSCGIPSRVMSGYLCCGWNPWLNRWVVRERDGHAWVEVWDRTSERWLVADPTPPDGRPAALNKPGKFRLAFDFCVAGWKRFLAYLRGTRFLEVLAEVGTLSFLFLWHVAWSLPGMVVLIGFGVIGWLRHRTCRRKLTPTERLRSELVLAMQGFERRAVAAHLRRRSPESWCAWLQRIAPELPPGRLEKLRERLESYQVLRYSATLDADEARAWLARTKRENPKRNS